MTSPEISCAEFEDKGIDLLFDLLDPEEAAALHAHARGCPNCAREWEKLRDGAELAEQFPLAEVPSGLLDATVAAARRARSAGDEPHGVKAVASVPPATTSAASDEEEDGGVVLWLSTAARWALRPQVAMVASILLVVGMGLWLPMSFRQDVPMAAEMEVADGVQPSPVDELPPGLDYAEQEPEETERQAEPVQPVEQPRAVAQQAADPAVESERFASRRAAGEAEQGRMNAELRSTGTTTIREPSDADEGRSALSQNTEARGGEGRGARSMDDSLQRQEVLRSNQDESDRPTSTTGLAPEIATATPQAAPSPPAELAENEESTDSEELADGESAGYEGESDRSSLLLAPALHRQARDFAANGRCDRARTSYELLLTRYRNYPRRGRAMIEHAQCLRQLGLLSSAERWLTQARAIPSVRGQADLELARLRALRQAPASASGSSVEPASE